MSAPTAVRLLAHWPTEWAAVVDYTDRSVVVRHNAIKRHRYKCADCGPQHTPACPHLRAGALAVQARDLLTQTGRNHD